MKAKLLLIISGMLYLPFVANAQTMLEKRERTEQLERERAVFKIFMAPNGQVIGVNPNTKQPTVVKNYIGMFENQQLRRKMLIQYVPETNDVAAYFIEEDDRGNVMYIEELLNEHGVFFNKNTIKERVLAIIKSEQL